MQKIDNDFFEAYKRLDRLCSDIYGCRSGVSRYIEDLERVPYPDCLAVPALKQSYKELKHLRWVRNQMAHDSGQFQICEERDIQYVNDFYDAIIKGEDPLTKLRKYREADGVGQKQSCRTISDAMPPVSNPHDLIPPARRSRHFGKVFLICIGIYAILVYLLLRFL